MFQHTFSWAVKDTPLSRSQSGCSTGLCQIAISCSDPSLWILRQRRIFLRMLVMKHAIVRHGTPMLLFLNPSGGRSVALSVAAGALKACGNVIIPLAGQKKNNMQICRGRSPVPCLLGRLSSSLGIIAFAITRRTTYNQRVIPCCRRPRVQTSWRATGIAMRLENKPMGCL